MRTKAKPIWLRSRKLAARWMQMLLFRSTWLICVWFADPLWRFRSALKSCAFWKNQKNWIQTPFKCHLNYSIFWQFETIQLKCFKAHDFEIGCKNLHSDWFVCNLRIHFLCWTLTLSHSVTATASIPPHLSIGYPTPKNVNHRAVSIRMWGRFESEYWTVVTLPHHPCAAPLS